MIPNDFSDKVKILIFFLLFIFAVLDSKTLNDLC